MLLDPRSNRDTNAHRLADMVFERLAEDIVQGRLRPGHWVSENELAARLGVSRSPVREALRGLAQEGIVEVRRRRGTIIAELSSSEADDLYRARELIEPEMARCAVLHISDSDVEELALIAEELRSALGDRSRFYDCTLRFWQRVLDCCPNRTLRDVVAMLWRRSIRFRGLLFAIPHAPEDQLAFTDEFVAFARDRNADGAAATTADIYSKIRRTLFDEAFIDLGGEGRLPRPVGAER